MDMEAFLPYVFFPVLVLCLYLIISLPKSNSNTNNTKNLPPGTRGWPVLGENIAYVLSGAEKFVNKRMERYSSEVFRTSLFGENMAVFCGPKGNKFLFMNEDILVKSWWPHSSKRVIMPPELMDRDIRMSAKFHYDFLRPENLKEYVPVMDAMAREHIECDWKPYPVVKVQPLSKKFTLALACRLMLSVVDQEHVKKLVDPFMLLNNGIISVPIDLPGTAYNRAVKGGAMLREEVMKIIKERRKENKGQQDILSKMLAVTDENGRFLSEMEVSSNVVSLLMANFTTSNAVSYVISYLGSLPHIYDEVLKEQMEIAKSKGPGELLTWEDIDKMKFSWNVVRESLRLLPPARGAFRETITEFSYAGFTIPKGWKTFWTVNSTHKNPKYFPEPEKFDPSRFEGIGPAPNTFVPFGGGPRMCAGKEHARLQILVFIHNVVIKFKLEKVFPDEKIVVRAPPKLRDGLPVRLLPHES